MREAFIDRVFRGYGEEFFGKRFMDTINSKQVEEARCFAMQELNYLTAKYGKQKQGAERELFCNYIFEKFA